MREPRFVELFEKSFSDTFIGLNIELVKPPDDKNIVTIKITDGADDNMLIKVYLNEFIVNPTAYRMSRDIGPLCGRYKDRIVLFLYNSRNDFELWCKNKVNLSN